jgi:hypothetical protein
MPDDEPVLLYFRRSRPALAQSGRSVYGARMEQPQFWFNTRTGQVETNEDKSQSKDLLGPYPTKEEAAQALETARRRTEAWDEEDRRWRDGDEDD